VYTLDGHFQNFVGAPVKNDPVFRQRGASLDAFK
jgi:hypothetical protein